MKKEITEPTRSIYKGTPILSLPTGNGYGFSFGLKKAQALLEHIEEVKSFVEDNDQPTGEDSILDNPAPASLSTAPGRD